MPPHKIRRRATKRRKRRREFEGDDVFQPDPAAVARKMQWPRAAIGEQRELGRMDALAGDNPAQSIVGVGLQHVDHALSRLMHGHAQHICALLFEDALCLGNVQLHLAAEEIVWVQPPENCIAIGDGRLHAAAPKADRPRIRPGAFWPQRNLLGQRINLQDHARARADGVQMQRRQIELEAVHDGFVFEPRLAARDHAHVKRRTTHVRTDQVVVTDHLANIGSTQDSAYRARNHGFVQAWMLDRREPAERQQRLHAIFEAMRLRDFLDAFQLRAAPRGGIGFDQHAVQPRLLADHGADLVARIDADVSLGPLNLFSNDLCNALLVRRVHMREQEADADPLNLVLDQRLGRSSRFVLVHRNDHVAELVHALGHTIGPAAGHQGCRMLVRDRVQPIRIGIVGPGLQAAAHQDHILSALGGDQPQPASGAREQRVQHAGARIEHNVNAAEQLVQRNAPGFCRILGRGQKAFGLIARRRRGFADLEPPVLIDQDGVGHSAASVDTDDDWVQHGRFCMATARLCAREISGKVTAAGLSPPYDNCHA